MTNRIRIAAHKRRTRKDPRTGKRNGAKRHPVRSYLRCPWGSLSRKGRKS